MPKLIGSFGARQIYDNQLLKFDIGVELRMAILRTVSSTPVIQYIGKSGTSLDFTIRVYGQTESNNWNNAFNTTQTYIAIFYGINYGTFYVRSYEIRDVVVTLDSTGSNDARWIETEFSISAFSENPTIM